MPKDRPVKEAFDKVYQQRTISDQKLTVAEVQWVMSLPRLRVDLLSDEELERLREIADRTGDGY